MPACRLCLLTTGLLLGLLLFTPLSAAAPAAGAVKPGVCPQLQERADCVKECSSDSQCLNNFKCCQAGCSSVCSSPNGLNQEKLLGTTAPSANHTSPSAGGRVSTTTAPAVAREEGDVGVESKPLITTAPAVAREQSDVEKQGTCPSVDFPKLGICEDQCQMDSQCSGNMKCCRNGCGKMTCSTPTF